MARGHHHRDSKRDEEREHEKHRARGGRSEAGVPPEDGGHVMDYTGENNVAAEAKGARRKRGGGVHHHNKHHGDHKAEHEGHHESAHHHSSGHHSHHGHHTIHMHLKKGGKVRKEVEGEAEHGRHRRLDRPGRKRGGGVGADRTPLSTANRPISRSGHIADNNEMPGPGTK